jgi:hypothetical protein
MFFAVEVEVRNTDAGQSLPGVKGEGPLIPRVCGEPLRGSTRTARGLSPNFCKKRAAKGYSNRPEAVERKRRTVVAGTLVRFRSSIFIFVGLGRFYHITSGRPDKITGNRY